MKSFTEYGYDGNNFNEAMSAAAWFKNSTR